MSTFAERLNLLRREKKWTQDKLADLLDVSKSTISMYENGNRTPSFEIEEQIADLFNVDLEYLRGRSNSRNREYNNYLAELKTMASKIRTRCIELDYSYEKLAELTGISASSLNRYETGNIRNLPIDKFELLATALKLDPAKLFNEVRNEEVKKTFENVVETLKSLGATVEDVEMDKKLMKTLLPTYTIIANSEATSNHSCLDGVKYGDRQQGDTPDDVMINSRTDGFGDHIKRRFILGNLALATENQEKMFRKAQRVRRLVVDELNKIYENYDIIIAPNGGGVAPLIDEAAEDYLSDEYIILENWLCLANFAGTPSISIPSGFVDNMPVAVNISGRIFEEQTVLNVAYALEEALGFKNQYKRED